jgi:hypothetical protein
VAVAGAVRKVNQFEAQVCFISLQEEYPMAKWRQAGHVKEGEYHGSATWRTGHGIEERERAAEGIGIKVSEKWVYLYLRDGEEIVKLMRTTNTLAQIYPGMSLRDVMRERTLNYVINSTTCRQISNGELDNCEINTPEWMERAIEKRLSSIISDEDWPSVLAARKVEAQRAQEYLERKAQERQLAQVAGGGEWRQSQGCWKVWTLRQPKAGEAVIVLSRSGETTEVIIDSSYQTATGWLSESHPA